ncbi:MAG: carotenoid biosynthesis protein [Patescibacteria group bacterium]
MQSKNVNFFLANLFFAAIVLFYIFMLWQGELEQGFILTAFFTLSVFAFTLWHAFSKFGIRNAIIFLILVLFVSLGAEFIGANLANNFEGYYQYSDFLGWKFLNIPLLIIFMWTAIIYLSYQVSEHITNFRFTKQTHFLQKFWVSFWCALLTSLIVVAWDFALEPLAIGMGWWSWLRPGEYFGVPISNFLGWMAISFSVVFLYKIFFERERPEEANLFDYAPAIGYALICFFTILTAINIDKPLFALIAFVGMFPFVCIMVIKFLVSRLNFPEQYRK